MSTENTFVVVTTIQPPTDCMKTLAGRVRAEGLKWLVVGDRKGPSAYPLPPAELVSIEQQRRLPFRTARLLPERHYARKNLGYLLAMACGCECLYETDDDNAPLDTWRPRSREIAGYEIEAHHRCRWVNIYEAFTTEQIWPRGLPLPQARRHFADNFVIERTPVWKAAPIQQGLANGSPDVDAVWRLVLDHDVVFDDAPNLLVPHGVWCPFNSQNTWWWREVFPLLYLPSHCSFRMTDIWRSFVAQRCLWELGHELEFHQADVHQDRNEHDLMCDFDHETVGYLRNDEFCRILEACALRAGPAHLEDNLFRCYEALATAGMIDRAELPLVKAWLEDCQEINANAGRESRAVEPAEFS
ncbi:MAG TPA: STELLO glycosyltransferase family protein [Opitutaceae bacterium]|nr:STELLO glycosyltransferase family protein [Opitutaceae bacterium]